MSASGDALWVLRNWFSEQGVHPADVIVEFHSVSVIGTNATLATNINNLLAGFATYYGAVTPATAGEIPLTVSAFTTGTVNSVTIAQANPATAATYNAYVMLVGRLDV
jgi:hypothetical protein